MRILLFYFSVLSCLTGSAVCLYSQSFLSQLLELDDGFYVDKQEVSNGDWKTYLNWLAQQDDADSVAYRAAYPDTSVWRALPMQPDDVMVKQYFSHPAYDDYPVVGISYEQAQQYCQWRGERAQEMLGPSAKEQLVFRLPSQSEWLLIRRFNHPGIHYPLKKKDQGKLKFNTRRPTPDYAGIAMPNRHPQLTASVRSYLPSEKGVYHLYGNVAEMLAEPGLAMGGSFFHSKNVIYSGVTQSYTEPTFWLGLRCVAISTKLP